MGGKSKASSTSGTTTQTDYNNLQGNSAPAAVNNVNVSVSGSKNWTYSPIAIYNELTDYGAIQAAGELTSQNLEAAEKVTMKSLEILESGLIDSYQGAKDYAENITKEAFDFAQQAAAPDEEKTKQLMKYGVIGVTLMVAAPFIARKF